MSVSGHTDGPGWNGLQLEKDYTNLFFKFSYFCFQKIKNKISALFIVEMHLATQS